MNHDQKNIPAVDDSNNENDAENSEDTITLHNPLKPGTDITVSKEAIDNEQKYKEAITERD